jgi:hypothetical protein
MGRKRNCKFSLFISQSKDDGKRSILFQSMGPNIKLENGIGVFCAFRKTNCCF